MKDIIIIGAGPAGLTAAIYALRAGKSVLIFERKSYGGQISQSHKVENYPGYASISGGELTAKLMEQVKTYGGETAFADVTGVTDGKVKTVKTNMGDYECKTVIFALGADAKHTGVEGEEKFIGRGVSYCALCDGNFFRKKEVAVIGGGSTALHDAIYLSEICDKVHLIHRRDTFRGEISLAEKAETTDNIIMHKSCVLSGIQGEKLLEKITVRSVRDGSEREIPVRGLFVAIGQKPATEAFSDILPLDEYGYVKADENCTVGEGLFVCGDCRQKAVRQLTTATADGSVAAVKACEYLDI